MSLRLDWCSHKAAKFAVEHWHYSKCMPVPPTVRIGVWEDRKYIGVVIFSRGASPSLGIPFGLEQTEICELTRVALKKHYTSVTKILSIAIKMLKNKSDIKLIISFADSNQNHLGKIYQAGNWFYLGKTNKTFLYYDEKERQYHSRQVSEKGFNIQFGEKRIVRKPSTLKKVIQKGKFRYVYPLTKEMREKIKPLAKPYPKRL